MIARNANAQGYVTLANTVKVLAKNETVHARRFFEELNKYGTFLDNIELENPVGDRAGSTPVIRTKDDKG